VTIGETLIKKFGAERCLSIARSVAEDRYLWMCRYENDRWESLRSHNDTKFPAYNAADSSVRSEMCLEQYEYAENAIIAASLSMYMDAMKKLAKKDKTKQETKEQ